MIKLFKLPSVSIISDMILQGFLRTLIDTLDEGARYLESKEILGGHRLTGINVPATTATAVNHKLGHTPIGWKVTDVDAAATIYRTAWDEYTITLYASAEVNIDLWVF